MTKIEKLMNQKDIYTEYQKVKNILLKDAKNGDYLDKMKSFICVFMMSNSGRLFPGFLNTRVSGFELFTKEKYIEPSLVKKRHVFPNIGIKEKRMFMSEEFCEIIKLFIDSRDPYSKLLFKEDFIRHSKISGKEFITLCRNYYKDLFTIHTDLFKHLEVNNFDSDRGIYNFNGPSGFWVYFEGESLSELLHPQGYAKLASAIKKDISGAEASSRAKNLLKHLFDNLPEKHEKSLSEYTCCDCGEKDDIQSYGEKREWLDHAVKELREGLCSDCFVAKYGIDAAKRAEINPRKYQVSSRKGIKISEEEKKRNEHTRFYNKLAKANKEISVSKIRVFGQGRTEYVKGQKKNQFVHTDSIKMHSNLENTPKESKHKIFEKNIILAIEEIISSEEGSSMGLDKNSIDEILFLSLAEHHKDENLSPGDCAGIPIFGDTYRCSTEKIVSTLEEVDPTHSPSCILHQ